MQTLKPSKPLSSTQREAQSEAGLKGTHCHDFWEFWKLSKCCQICDNMAGIVGAAHLQPTCSLRALPAERSERPERRRRGTQACASFATTVVPGSAHGEPPRAEAETPGIGERAWTNLWITCYFKPYLRVQFFKLGLILLSKVRRGFYQAIKTKPSHEKLTKASFFYNFFLHILSYQTCFRSSTTNKLWPWGWNVDQLKIECNCIIWSNKSRCGQKISSMQ